MTRETKVGLIVAGSFLCLVCIVVASKWRHGNEPPTDAEEQSSHPVAAVKPTQNNDKSKDDANPKHTTLPALPGHDDPKKSDGAGLPPLVIGDNIKAELERQKAIALAQGGQPKDKFEFPPLDKTPITLDPKIAPPKPLEIVSDKDKPTFPPLDKDKGITFPPLDKDKGLTFPPLDKDKGLTFPPLDKDKGLTFPPLDKDKGLTFPPLDKDKGLTFPPLDKDKGFPLPPLEKDKGFPLPPLEKDKGLTVPPITDTPGSIPRIGAKEQPSIPPISVGGVRPIVKDVSTDSYVCKAGETNFAILSQRIYGSDKYAAALLAYNRDHSSVIPNGAVFHANPPLLSAGQQVQYPSSGILERDYRAFLSGMSGAPTIPPVTIKLPTPLTQPGNAGVVTIGSQAGKYLVQNPSGESILDIAERVLGNRSRWHEIYRINPNYPPQFRIPAGTELKMPGA